MSRKNKEAKLKIIPLGGLGEIGKNLTVLEYQNDIIVIDLGSIFPREDMPGVDLVIPDTSYLEHNREKIRGYFITHGHEDHIGAVPYVLRNLPAPVYGTKLTLALCEHKLKEHRLQNVAPLNVVTEGDVIRAGCFSVEFIHVNHSIAGACALAIKTPVGTVVHTGDFKVDYTPMDGAPIDLGRLAELGQEGVLALLCDSTNAERPGYTMSEKKVAATFNELFQKADGPGDHRHVRQQRAPHPVGGGLLPALPPQGVPDGPQHGERVQGGHAAGLSEDPRRHADLRRGDRPLPRRADRRGHHRQPGRAHERPFPHGLRRAPQAGDPRGRHGDHLRHAHPRQREVGLPGHQPADPHRRERDLRFPGRGAPPATPARRS